MQHVMLPEAAIKISQEEKSIYYRGLLILIRRDRIIDSRERELMLKIGEMLDFDKRFCEATIDDLMKNPHIKRKPVTFRDIEVAKSFLRDSVRLAFVDQELHRKEMAWLGLVAQANGISIEWLDDIVQPFLEGRHESDPPLKEIQRHL